MEWKAQCALDLCSGDTQDHLRGFGYRHFRHLARRFANTTNTQDAEVLTPSAAEAWQRFESHLAVKATQEGKRYKDWLFDRTRQSTDPAISVLEGGAALLMRDVVREILRREHSGSGTVSMNAPIVGDGSLSLEDLLPGGISPADDAARREFEDLGRQHAETFIPDMRYREKVAALARALGVPFSHPAVEIAANCRKSMVSLAYRELTERLSAHIAQQYPDDDRESVLLVTLVCLDEVHQRLLEWGKSEMRVADLFNVLGGTLNPPGV